MRRLHVTLWLACPIVCGYAAPSRADIVFTASTSGTAPLYSFSLNATVTLNDAETEARVMVQTQLASPACSSIEICYFVKSLRMAGPGLSVAVGADVVVPLTPEQVEALTTEQFSIFATIGPTRPDIAEDVNFSAVLRPAAGQHFRTYVLAEGATGSFFDTDLLILNPNSLPTRLDITYRTESGAVILQRVDVAAWSRHTIRVDDVPGLDATTMTTRVRALSDTPLAIERTMRWNASGYEGHTEQASASAERTWYFAEGAQGFFRTYLLLANGSAVGNTASVRFLREGRPPVTRNIALAPLARTTVDLGTIPELQDQSFGMEVLFDQPGTAERATYVGTDPFFSTGHGSVGATRLAKEWLLAEGATGPFFETFVLVANPSAVAADLTVRYLTIDGTMITRHHRVPPFERLTLDIEGEGSPALQNTGVSTFVTSTIPVVVERSQYWPGSTPLQWYGAHASVGLSVDTLTTTWGLAEGRVGGPEHYQTYFLLANPRLDDAVVSIRFVPEGGTPFMREFVVPGLTRVTVATGPGTSVPELQDGGFGAHLQSTRPIAVERSMYWDANGIIWAAGTNGAAIALGTPPPSPF